jgi:hypothetical protein
MGLLSLGLNGISGEGRGTLQLGSLSWIYDAELANLGNVGFPHSSANGLCRFAG